MNAPETRSEPLVIYAIYDHPSDAPDYFVAKRWFVYPGTEQPQVETTPYAIHFSLEHLRGMLPPGLVCLARCDGDDPVILETWL